MEISIGTGIIAARQLIIPRRRFRIPEPVIADCELYGGKKTIGFMIRKPAALSRGSASRARKYQ